MCSPSTRITALALGLASAAFAAETPRARDLGVPFDGTPGPLNAITDVAGVEVGHATLVSGEGKLVVGQGPVRTGSVAMNGSGDLFVAFSTANPGTFLAKTAVAARVLPNEAMNPLITATVEATEEAVVNALVAGRTTTGIDGHRVLGLPHDRLRDALAKYGRRR